MDTTDWRTTLQPDSRQRIVNKIMDTLKKHLPVSGQEGLHELKKIAERFEEKIYTAATSQSDYLRKISLKMLTMETKSQNTIPNSLPSNPVGNSSRPPDPVSVGMESQVHNQGQQLALPQEQQQQPKPQLMAQQANYRNNFAVMQQQQQMLLGQQQPQPQPQFVGQQANSTNISAYLQHQQQQQRMLVQRQQQQQQIMKQLMAQQNTLSNLHQQQLDLKSKAQLQQQPQQTASSLLPTQAQQSQPQPQMIAHFQLQQQMDLQQQPNSLQLDMLQNVIDQQKQLYQSQRALPETSSTSVDSTTQTGHASGGDWQEEVYQKIKSMKDQYLPELSEMYQKIAAKLQQLDSLPQQPMLDQHEKLKLFKVTLELAIGFLQVPKANILPGYKEKLAQYENQIVNFITRNRPRKPASQLQQGLPPSSHIQPMQQPQSQINQVQPHENQMNPQLQPMNVQGSVATLQQNNMTSSQQNCLSALSGVSTTHQNMRNSLHPSSNIINPGQLNALNSFKLQPNINNTLQSNSGMLQNQHHMRQQPEEQAQLMTLFLPRHLQQLQQQQQQEAAKQQLPAHLAKLQIQMPQLHQINDVNDLKMKQNMGVKPAEQPSSYPHQKLKPGFPSPIPSNQLHQASSPQNLKHSSPQGDQQKLLASPTKVGTPSQSINSPVLVSSRSTPLAPSPMSGDPEKPLPVFSGLGMRRVLNVLMVIGWILVTVAFIVGGVFLFHNAVSDSCVAMDEWVGNPTAYESKDGTFQLFRVVNQLITYIVRIICQTI